MRILHCHEFISMITNTNENRAGSLRPCSVVNNLLVAIMSKSNVAFSMKTPQEYSTSATNENIERVKLRTGPGNNKKNIKTYSCTMIGSSTFHHKRMEIKSIKMEMLFYFDGGGFIIAIDPEN